MTSSLPRAGSWMSARKLGVGRAGPGNRTSHVWWTCVADGVSECCFPTVDRPAIRGADVLAELPDGRLVDPHRRLVRVVRRERRAPDVAIVTEPDDGTWLLVTEPLADPSTDAIRIRWSVRPGGTSRGEPAELPVALVVRVEPRLLGSGHGHEAGVDAGGTAVAWKDGLALAARAGEAGAGVEVAAEPIEAAAGRVVLTFRLPLTGGAADLAIGFGEADAAARAAGEGGGGDEARAAGAGSARDRARVARERALAALDATLGRTFDDVLADELGGWRRWAAGVQGGRAAARVRDDPLGWESLVLFHALEDVTYPGAIIASPSRPWSDAGDDHDPAENGYRHVWARDLYHVAMGLLAAGDTEAFLRVADEGLPRLVRPDGYVPQNAAVDGTQAWKAEQLDEVADAVLLAWRASQVDPARAAWRLERMIRPCADRCAELGPATRQERWEEQPGYSPSTLAAAIAALVCAADAAESVRRTTIDGGAPPEPAPATDAARWLATADAWEAGIDGWTVVPDGTHVPPRPALPLPAWSPRPAETVTAPFHLRIAPHGRPAAADTMRMADDGPVVDQRHVVDAGFLELVRVGIRDARDARILASLDRADEDLRAATDRGTFWYRYSGDRYGEAEPGGAYPGRGHPWVHLAGERGHWALAAGRADEAAELLVAMVRAANEGGMVPEQVWEITGLPTGAAAPLAWAHAELLGLRRSLLDGGVFDMPEPVRRRYLGR